LDNEFEKEGKLSFLFSLEKHENFNFFYFLNWQIIAEKYSKKKVNEYLCTDNEQK